MRRLLSPLALALTGFLVAAAPAAAGRPVCAGPSFVTGAKARLVVKNGSLFGCVRGVRRAVRITDTDDYSSWEKPRLAGRFVAVEVVLKHKCRFVDIQVTNLRTGVARTFQAGTASYASSAHGCDSYGTPTTDMVLRSDGAVAFIAGGTEVARGGGSMRAGHHSIVRLESSPLVAPQSLGLTRSGLVTWWSNGQQRSAVLPARPRRPSA